MGASEWPERHMVVMGKKEDLDDRLSIGEMEMSFHLPAKARAVAKPLREDIRERFGKEG